MTAQRATSASRGRWIIRISFLLCAISVWQFAAAAYIHAKAGLAQWLVTEAWQKIKQGEAQSKPWPWADTWPVARLSVPRLQIERMVLAGASGRTLAFGPGWMKASAEPGSAGSSIIAAHRDTHFAFLKQLQIGDAIEIESPQGLSAYTVTETQVVDSSRQRMLLRPDIDELVLVTCYPFDAIVPGGPLRYVVYASRNTRPGQAGRVLE